jgi:hypothetical protein
MRLFLFFLALVVLAAEPLHAKGCRTNCALVDALALTKLCPNLILDSNGKAEAASSPPSSRMLREEIEIYMDQIAQAKDICRPACFRSKNGYWPCSYLQKRSVTPLEQ